VDTLAEKKGVSRSAIIAVAIDKYFTEEERFISGQK
jgi:predicted transcriptional regulator